MAGLWPFFACYLNLVGEVLELAPLISFIGRHNSGKTTVLTGVISNLSSAGYKVALIKHAHHGLEIEASQDSEILLEAGADFVMASSPQLSIQYQRYKEEPDFAHIIKNIPEDMDLIIVEGFKKEVLPKIEVLRHDIDTTPMLLPQTLALISDFPIQTGLPVFDNHDIEAITRFILEQLGGSNSFLTDKSD